MSTAKKLTNEEIICALRKELAAEEAAHTITIDQRDAAMEAADQLAYTVFSVAQIGEHSNRNDPWKNAANLLAEIVAERDLLRSELAVLRPIVEKQKEQSC